MRVMVTGIETVAHVDAGVQAGATAIGIDFPRGLADARVLVDRVPRGVEAIARFAGPVDAAVLDLGFDGVEAPRPPDGLARAGVFFVRHAADGPDLTERLGEPAKGTLVSGSLRGCVVLSADADPERLAAAASRHPIVLHGAATPDAVRALARSLRPVGFAVAIGQVADLGAWVVAARQ